MQKVCATDAISLVISKTHSSVAATANVPPINEVVNKCNSFLTCVFFEIKRYGSDNRAGQFYAFINTVSEVANANLRFSTRCLLGER